jgi:hypothetical protein
VLDGDHAFRQAAISFLASDEFISTLQENGSLTAEGVARHVEKMASDNGQLFQRERITETLVAQRLLTGNRELALLHMMLDKAFSTANTQAAGLALKSLPLDCFALRVVAQNISFKNGTLAHAIEQMAPITISELSHQSEWRLFVASLANELEKIGPLLYSHAPILPARLHRLIPSRRYAALQAIGAMIVAFLISPIFGSGAASRVLSALFTDAPAWVMAALNGVVNRDLTSHILSVKQKIPKLASYGAPMPLQPLAPFGLIFDSKHGYRQVL